MTGSAPRLPPAAHTPPGARGVRVGSPSVDDDALLILHEVLIRVRRWRRGRVHVYPDRIEAATTEGRVDLRTATVARVARVRRTFTGVRLIVEGPDGSLQVRGLTPADAARAQRIIGEAVRAAR